MLELLGEMLEGRPVALSDVLYVRSALLQVSLLFLQFLLQFLLSWGGFVVAVCGVEVAWIA